MLVRSATARTMFDGTGVLVSAKNFAALIGAGSAHVTQAFDYWHILCASHAEIFANTVPVETLFPGPVAIGTLWRQGLQRRSNSKILTLLTDRAMTWP